MTALALVALALWCCALSIIDIRTGRLPDILTGGGALVVFGYALIAGDLAAGATGAILLVVPYALVHLVAPAAFGAGDVKLAFPLGAVTGLAGGSAWVCAAAAAPVITALVGICRYAFASIGHSPRGIHASYRARAGPGAPAGDSMFVVPHGPSMCLATILSLLML